MKKFSIKSFLTAAFLVALISFSFAQVEKRISFERGKSSATVSEKLAADTVEVYNLRVKKGQKITIKVSSANGKVDLDTANFSAGEFEEPGHKFLNLPIDQTGDYQIYVRNTGKTAMNFTLIVTVR